MNQEAFVVATIQAQIYKHYLPLFLQVYNHYFNNHAYIWDFIHSSPMLRGLPFTWHPYFHCLMEDSQRRDCVYAYHLKKASLHQKRSQFSAEAWPKTSLKSVGASH